MVSGPAHAVVPQTLRQPGGTRLGLLLHGRLGREGSSHAFPASRGETRGPPHVTGRSDASLMAYSRHHGKSPKREDFPCCSYTAVPRQASPIFSSLSSHTIREKERKYESISLPLSRKIEPGASPLVGNDKADEQNPGQALLGRPRLVDE